MQDPYGKEINDEVVFLEESRYDLLNEHGLNDPRYLFFMIHTYNPRMDRIREYVSYGAYPLENADVC